MKVEVRIKKWKWKWSWKSKRIKPKKEKVRAKKVKVTLKRWKHKDKKTVNKSKSQGEGVSMSRVWRCQSCNGNCDKGHGRGNAAGRKRGRTGWGFGMGGTLPVIFSEMDFSKLLQILQISSNSRVKSTFWIFGAALEVWWSTSICIPLAREPGFLPFLNLISSQLYFSAPRPKRGSFFTKMMKILHQQSVHVSCPDGSDIESFWIVLQKKHNWQITGHTMYTPLMDWLQNMKFSACIWNFFLLKRKLYPF